MNTRSTNVSTELRGLLGIALPLVAAYLAEYAMFTTTKIVVGQLGYEQLAAIGLAGGLTFEILVVLQGLLSVVGVLIAQSESQGEKRAAGHATRQGVLVALLLAVPFTFVVWRLDVLMMLTHQQPQVIEIAKPFLLAVAPAVAAILLFSVLRSFVAALSRTVAVMVITVAAVGINYVLTLGLVHGRFGLPEMGVSGAGVAMSIVSWLMLVALLAYAWFNSSLRGYGLFRGRIKVDLITGREILLLGIPVAGLVLLEGGLFMAVSILSGIIGVKSLAAYEIVMGWVGIPFVVALGIAEGTMVRVAYASGRKDAAASRFAGIVGLGVGIGLLLLLVVVPVGFPNQIAALFLERDDPGYTDVVNLATTLLIIAAVFQVFDGIQAIASRALRALKDTVAPLWLAAFGYWVLGIGGGCLFAFIFELGATGLWLGMAIGLIVTGSLLTWRFFSLTREGRFSPQPEA